MSATASPAECPATGTPAPARTDAERWAMVQSVEGLVKKLVAAVGFRSADREDVCQDARVDLFKAAARYDPARGAKWSSFAYGVVRKCIANYCRARSDAPSGPMVVEPVGPRWDWETQAGNGPDPAERAMANEEAATAAAGDDAETWAAFADLLREQLQRALLDYLNPRTREAVRLCLAGNTPDQVAVQLGVPVKDVKLMIRNAAAAIDNRIDPAKRAEREAKRAATSAKRAATSAKSAETRRRRAAAKSAAGRDGLAAVG